METKKLYRVQNVPPVVTILSQMNPVHPPPFYCLKINFEVNLTHTHTHIYTSSMWSPSTKMPTKTLHTLVFYPLRATWPADHPRHRHRGCNIVAAAKVKHHTVATMTCRPRISVNSSLQNVHARETSVLAASKKCTLSGVQTLMATVKKCCNFFRVAFSCGIILHYYF